MEASIKLARSIFSLKALMIGVLFVGAGLVAVPATASDPGFRLPFENGRQFQITQGPTQHAAGAYPEYNRHAIDFDMQVGTPVLSSAGGTIQFEGYDSTGAIQVRIDHGGDRCTQYVHLSRTVINSGQTVDRGQLIGYSGNTGLSSGPHLHFNMVYCSTQRSREVVNTLEMGTTYPVGLSARSQNGPAGVNDPRGSFDAVSSPRPGVIRVTGWAFDPDDVRASVNIHAYVGGPAGSPGATGHDLGPATRDRPDVAAAYPGVGNQHGFDATVEARGGTTAVYVYAINRAGTPGGNVLLGRRDVVVANADPVGSLDAVTSPQGGEIRVRGWTFDPSDTSVPINFHVYVGGPAGDPNADGFAFGPARSLRSDVEAAYPGVGTRHGFNWAFATTKTGRLPVFVYAIDIGPGDNALLGSATVEVGEGPPQISVVTRPAISGVPRVGRTLRTSGGSWTVGALTKRYQWTRNGNPIRGARAASYQLRAADRGRRIRVRVLATRDGYVKGVAISKRTSPVS